MSKLIIKYEGSWANGMPLKLESIGRDRSTKRAYNIYQMQAISIPFNNSLSNNFKTNIIKLEMWYGEH